MNRLAIPDLTDEQAIELSKRDDLPDDIEGQVNARMVSLQHRYARESQIIKKVGE